MLQQSRSRAAFYGSLDRQWELEEATDPAVYPDSPGPLVLAEQRLYRDDLEAIEPTGWGDVTHRRGTVMVVDGSPAYRMSLKSQLESEGYDVIVAEEGWDALGQPLAGVDMRVVDISMPRMTGIELVSIVHQREGLKNLPVVIITSAEVGDWVGKAAAVGATVLSELAKEHLLHEIRVGLHPAAAWLRPRSGSAVPRHVGGPDRRDGGPAPGRDGRADTPRVRRNHLMVL